MPYIGKSPVSGGFHKLGNLTASATATYALTLNGAAYYPETANQLLVSLNGVIQAPQDSFTVSGSNLVFDSALTSSDSIDFVVALGDVLGVGSVTDGAITTAKLGNNAVTDAKLANTLDLSSKTLTLPSGYLRQVYDSGFISIADNTWTTVTHNIALPYKLQILQKVTATGSAGHNAEYADNDVLEIPPNSELDTFGSTGFHTISKDNIVRAYGHGAVGAVASNGGSTGYIPRLETNGTRFLIYKAQ